MKKNVEGHAQQSGGGEAEKGGGSDSAKGMPGGIERGGGPDSAKKAEERPTEREKGKGGKKTTGSETTR